MSRHNPKHGMKPEDLLGFALGNYPQAVSLCDARTYYVESTRGGDDRDGTLTCQMPDEIVKALRGPPDKARFRLLWLAIPFWVENRAKSRLVLPQGAGNGGGLIVPGA